MKRIFTFFILLAYLNASIAYAAAGAYIYDSRGKAVLNSKGECWRAASWNPASGDCIPVAGEALTMTPSLTAPPAGEATIAAPAAVAAPGMMDNVMGNIDSSLPPKEELMPSAAQEKSPPSQVPPGAAAATAQPGLESTTGQPDATVTEEPPGAAYPSATSQAMTESDNAATAAGDGEITPEWMKKSTESQAQQQPVKKKRSHWPPVQVIIVLIFDVLLAGGVFSHLWH